MRQVRSAIIFRTLGRILQLNCQDHDVKKVFLWGSNNVYVQDFTDTKQLTNIFKEQRYIINVPFEKIEKDRYQIGIMYKSE